ncbi:2-oxoacid:ferredoxin oxidoreductase subunit beta [Pseudomaricurvus alkylphenolicus]|uniref:2-oxoacid:ferredoxin oxidoreductase subunit beta n=1 Tax=Pseudomaricurvus alkylphenolicus TaxID=1306991 RepID=UPI00142305ED|nr:2-oxoacid:ferredoxin oxidoreductase subunit beta [Pseudomaricurvus alkylphenolicus]NIB42272.1 2-oxoacid:ferredoxin oxidoreductase subunit beta [Pseudomaricurvus alkylphenolicus]
MNQTEPLNIPTYQKEDFASDQTPRWCPGCGDYSILAQLQRVMPAIAEQTQTPRENMVFISGIGCSSRFPYYMNTYGFHSIHGRAPTLALGLQVSRPELMTWVVTGDGDALSIGGNHLMHCLRRNLNVKILLFNNRIYGLTKGQYSPTSELGKRTKSSPLGSVARPLNPLSIALASQATFVARAVDRDPKLLQDVITQAALHKGSAIVEIYQNCNIFNDGAFAHVSERKSRDDNTLKLQHGEPLVFGRQRDKAVVLNEQLQPRVVATSEISESDLLIHDTSRDNSGLTYALSQLQYPEFPVPVGIFRALKAPTYEERVHQQVNEAKRQKPATALQQLLDSGETWRVAE